MLPHKDPNEDNQGQSNRRRLSLGRRSSSGKAKDKVKPRFEDETSLSNNKTFLGIIRTIEQMLNGQLNITANFSDDQTSISFFPNDKLNKALASRNRTQRGLGGFGRSLQKPISKQSKTSIHNELQQILSGTFEQTKKIKGSSETIIKGKIDRLYNIFTHGNSAVKKNLLQPNPYKAALILALGCIHPYLNSNNQDNTESRQGYYLDLAKHFINNFHDLPDFIITRLSLKQLEECIIHVGVYKQNHQLSLSLLDKLITKTQHPNADEAEVAELDIEQLIKYCHSLITSKGSINNKTHQLITLRASKIAEKILQHFPEKLPNGDNLQKLSKLYQAQSEIRQTGYKSEAERNQHSIQNAIQILELENKLVKHHEQAKKARNKKLIFPSLKTWRNTRPEVLSDLDEFIKNFHVCPNLDDTINVLVHRVTIILSLLIELKQRLDSLGMPPTSASSSSPIQKSLMSLANYCLKFLAYVYNREPTREFINNLVDEFSQPQNAIRQWQPNVLLATEDDEQGSSRQYEQSDLNPASLGRQDAAPIQLLKPDTSHFKNEIIPLTAIQMRRLLLTNMIQGSADVTNFYCITPATINSLFNLFEQIDDLYQDFFPGQDKPDDMQSFRTVVIETLFYHENYARDPSLKAFYSICEELNKLYTYRAKTSQDGRFQHIARFIQGQQDTQSFGGGFDHFSTSKTKTMHADDQIVKLNTKFDYETFIKTTFTTDETLNRENLIQELFGPHALQMHHEFMRFNQVFLNNRTREDHRLIIHKGRLMTFAIDSTGIVALPADTATYQSHGNVHRAACVWDHEGQMFYHEHSEQEAIKFFHTSFLGDKQLLFSGEVMLRDGFVLGITDHSGHFKPSDAHLYQFIRYLRENGIDLFNCIIFRNVYIGDTPIDTPSITALDFEAFYELKQNIIKVFSERYENLKDNVQEYARQQSLKKDKNKVNEVAIRHYFKMKIKRLKSARSPQELESILRHFHQALKSNKETKGQANANTCKRILRKDKVFMANLKEHCSNAQKFSIKSFKNLEQLINLDTKLKSIIQEVSVFIRAIEKRLEMSELNQDIRAKLRQLLSGDVKTIAGKNDNLLQLKKDIAKHAGSYQIPEFMRRFATLIEFYNNSCALPEVTEDFGASCKAMRTIRNKSQYQGDTITRIKDKISKAHPHARVLFPASGTESDTQEIEPYTLCPSSPNPLINDLAICLYATTYSFQHGQSQIIEEVNSHIAYALFLINALENHYQLNADQIHEKLLQLRCYEDMSGTNPEELIKYYRVLRNPELELSFPTELYPYIYDFAEKHRLKLRFLTEVNHDSIHQSVLYINQSRISDSSEHSHGRPITYKRIIEHDEQSEGELNTSSELNTSGNLTPRSDVSDSPSLRAFIKDLANVESSPNNERDDLNSSRDSLESAIGHLCNDDDKVPTIGGNFPSASGQGSSNGYSKTLNQNLDKILSMLNPEPDELSNEGLFALLDALSESSPELGSGDFRPLIIFQDQSTASDEGDSEGPSNEQRDRSPRYYSSAGSGSTATLFGRRLGRSAFRQASDSSIPKTSSDSLPRTSSDSEGSTIQGTSDSDTTSISSYDRSARRNGR